MTECVICKKPWDDHEMEEMSQHLTIWLADTELLTEEVIVFALQTMSKAVLLDDTQRMKTFLTFYINVMFDAMERRDKIRQLRER